MTKGAVISLSVVAGLAISSISVLIGMAINAGSAVNGNTSSSEVPSSETSSSESSTSSGGSGGSGSTHIHTAGTRSENVINPTCEKPGSYDYVTYCISCGEILSTEHVNLDPIGHNYLEPEYEWAPDYSSVVASRVCLNDETHIDKEQVNTVKQVIQEKSCTLPELSTFTASFQNPAFKQQVITVRTADELGHDWQFIDFTWNDNDQTAIANLICNNDQAHQTHANAVMSYIVKQESYCGQDEIRTYFAYYDGHVDSKDYNFPPTTTDHLPGAPVQENFVPASCDSEGGYDTVVYCAHCHAELSREHTVIPVDPTAHVWGDWEVTTPATCYENGEETRVCEHNAEHTETRPIQTLGHTPVHHAAVAPTCTEDGNFEYWSCSVCDKIFADPGCTVERTIEQMTIEPMGHNYVISYAWGPSFDSCVATAECRNVDDHSHDIICEAEVTSEVVSDPDCSNAGVRVYTATFDNPLFAEQTRSVPVNPTGHTPAAQAVIENNVDPDCTHSGSYDEVIYCTVCNAELSRNHVVVAATGHEWGEWDIEEEATCTEDGLRVRHCEHDNNHTEEQVIPATGHEWDDGEITTPATCTVDGVKTYHCEHCDEVKEEAIPATGHTFNNVVTAPTCESQGYTTHTCTKCGYAYVDTYVAALGHDYEFQGFEWDDDHPVAIANYVCANDANHTLSNAATMTSVVKTAATCTTNEVRTYTATFDTHSETKDYEVPNSSLGHNYVVSGYAWGAENDSCTGTMTCTNNPAHTTNLTTTNISYTVTVTPTCTATGVGRYTATFPAESGYSTQTKDVVLPMADHSLTTVQQNVVPETCDTAGSYDSVVLCSVCGTEFSRTHVVVEPSGHTWDEGEITTPATCTSFGEKTYHCSHCEETKVETIPMTAHNYVATVVPPTCEEQGYTSHECSVCHATYVDTYVDSLGHDYEFVDFTWNTTNHTATANYECSRCDAEIHHQATVTSEVVAQATCTTNETRRYTASYDTHNNTDPVVYEIANTAYGHHYADPVYVWAADNSSVTATKVCILCGHVVSETLDGGDIDYEITLQPTCTQAGTGVYTSDDFVDDDFEVQVKVVELPALGHDYNVEVHEATCTERGYNVYTCTRCSHEYIEYTTDEPLGHEFDHHAARSATCTEEGNIEYWYCSVCDKYFSDGEGNTEISAAEAIIPVIPHDLTGTEAHDPTCEDVGNIAYWTCNVCGHVFNDSEGHNEITIEETIVPALGHNFINEHLDPTCTEFGYDKKVCTREGCEYFYYENIIAPLGHEFDEEHPYAVIEPTCTEEGFIIVKCENCDEYLISSAMPALGHTYPMGEIQYEFSPDLEEYRAYSYCDRCGHKEIFAIATRQGEMVFPSGERDGYADVLYHFENNYIEELDVYLDDYEMHEVWSAVDSQGLRYILNEDGEGNLSYEVQSVTLSNPEAACDNTLNIPETYCGIPVTKISDNAFSCNSEVNYVRLSDNIIEIGEFAFEYTHMKDIYIPAGVQIIGQGAFAYCPEMCLFDVDPTNDFFASYSDNYGNQGILFNKELTEIIAYPNLLSDEVGMKTVDEIYHSFSGIRDYYPYYSQVIRFGDYSFAGNTIICELDFSSGEGIWVKEIGNCAFIDCENLCNVNVAENIEVLGYGPFAGCICLDHIVVSNDYYFEEDSIIYNADKDLLVQFPAGKTDPEVTLLETVQTIGKYAFYRAYSIYTIEFENVASLSLIDDNAFMLCFSLCSIDNVGYELTTIGEAAFYADSNFEHLNAVSGDDEDYLLGTISYTELSSIGKYAFGDCHKLGTGDPIVVPETVTVLNEGVFAGCNFEEINLPYTLLSSYDDAFIDCLNITDVYYSGDETQWSEIEFHNTFSNPLWNGAILHIDGHLYSIADHLEPTCTDEGYTLYSCSDCGSEFYADIVEPLGHDLVHHVEREATCTLDGYTQECWVCNRCGLCYADAECTEELNYNDVHVDPLDHDYTDEVDYIWATDEHYFGFACQAEKHCQRCGEQIVIQIATRFNKSGSVLPSGYDNGQIVITADFDESLGLEDQTMIYEDVSPVLYGVRYTLLEDGSGYSIRASEPDYDYSEEGLLIVDYYCGIPVVEIEEGAFQDNETVIYLNIPDTVTTIGDAAFRNCTQICNAGDSLLPYSIESVGREAFFNTGVHGEVNISSVIHYIGPGAFGRCNGLTSIYVDDSNEYYASYSGLLFQKQDLDGSYYYEHYERLIECPAGFEFENYYSLDLDISSLGIGEVSYIEELAFAGCNLTSAYIGHQVQYIGEGAFAFCHSLGHFGVDTELYCCDDGYTICKINEVLGVKNEVIIQVAGAYPEHEYYVPNETAVIGSYAFAGCDNIWNIHFDGISGSSVDYLSIKSYAFAECTGLGDVYIPDYVKYINCTAFEGCYDLAYFRIDDYFDIGPYIGGTGDGIHYSAPRSHTLLRDADHCTIIINSSFVFNPDLTFNLWYDITTDVYYYDNAAAFFIGLGGHNRQYDVHDNENFVILEGVNCQALAYVENPQNEFSDARIIVILYEEDPDNLETITLRVFKEWPASDGYIYVPTTIGYGAFAGIKDVVNVEFNTDINRVEAGAFMMNDNIEFIYTDGSAGTIDFYDYFLLELLTIHFDGTDFDLTQMELDEIHDQFVSNFAIIQYSSSDEFNAAFNTVEYLATIMGNDQYAVNRIDEFMRDVYNLFREDNGDGYCDLIGHHLWGHPHTVKPTCTEEGYSYRSCVICGAEDAHYDEVPALGHSLEHYDANYATSEHEGNIEYWYCNRCHKYFSDEGITEISYEDTIIPIVDHTHEIVGDVDYIWDVNYSYCSAYAYCSICEAYTFIEEAYADPQFVDDIYPSGDVSGTLVADAHFEHAQLEDQHIEQLISPVDDQGLRYTLRSFPETDAYEVSAADPSSLSGEITIPDIFCGYPVYGIADYGFFGCESLELVRFGSEIHHVGDNAFGNCPLLDGFDTDNNDLYQYDSDYRVLVGLIWNEGYPQYHTLIRYLEPVGSSDLYAFNTPDELYFERIGNYAFYDCDTLSEFNFTNSNVRYIGNCAFAECDSLTQFFIPEHVEWVGYGPFYGCDVLEVIDSDFKNFRDAYYFTYEGVLYGIDDYNGGCLVIQYPNGKVDDHIENNVGETITGIGAYAFYGETDLTDIQFISEANSVGAYAFYGCTGLYDSTYNHYKGSSYNDEYVYEGTYGNNYGNGTIYVGSTVRYVEKEAYANNSYATTVYIYNPNVISFAADAFINDTSINRVYFSGTLEQWNNIVFENDNGDPTKVGTNVRFFVTYNGGYIEISSVPSYAWNNDYSICTGYVIDPEDPNEVLTEKSYSVGVIDTYPSYEGSIQGRGSFTAEFTNPIFETQHKNNVALDYYVFRTYFRLDTDNMTYSIYRGYGCDYPGGKGVIPSTLYGLPVTKIEDGAYQYARSEFANVDVVVPSSITYLGDDVFDYNHLRSITFQGNVEHIGDICFYRCNYLTSVVFEGTVSEIGNRAFIGCSSLTAMPEMPGLVSIGDEAFKGCTSITQASFPATVSSIGDRIFENCNQLAEITVDPDNPYYSSLDGVLFDKEKETLIVYPNAKTTTYYTVPNTVTTIESDAFNINEYLNEITIGENVTEIGECNFKDFQNLASFSVDSDNPRYDGYRGVLYEKGAGGSYITLLAFATNQGDWVDEYGMTTLYEIPKSVTTISDYAFYNNDKLGLIQFESGADPHTVSILSYAFAECDNLSLVYFPDSIAFVNCTALEKCEHIDEIYIDGVFSIGANYDRYGNLSADSHPLLCYFSGEYSSLNTSHWISTDIILTDKFVYNEYYSDFFAMLAAHNTEIISNNDSIIVTEPIDNMHYVFALPENGYNLYDRGYVCDGTNDVVLLTCFFDSTNYSSVRRNFLTLDLNIVQAATGYRIIGVQDCALAELDTVTEIYLSDQLEFIRPGNNIGVNELDRIYVHDASQPDLYDYWIIYTHLSSYVRDITVVFASGEYTGLDIYESPEYQEYLIHVTGSALDNMKEYVREMVAIFESYQSQLDKIEEVFVNIDNAI